MEKMSHLANFLPVGEGGGIIAPHVSPYRLLSVCLTVCQESVSGFVAWNFCNVRLGQSYFGIFHDSELANPSGRLVIESTFWDWFSGCLISVCTDSVADLFKYYFGGIDSSFYSASVSIKINNYCPNLVVYYCYLAYPCKQRQNQCKLTN